MRLQDTFRADPNVLRSFPPGMAGLVSAGRACRVAVARATATETPRPQTEAAFRAVANGEVGDAEAGEPEAPLDEVTPPSARRPARSSRRRLRFL